MRLVKLLMPFADGIVAVSEGVASDLRAQVPRAASKVTTIYNPVVAPGLSEQAAALCGASPGSATEASR